MIGGLASFMNNLEFNGSYQSSDTQIYCKIDWYSIVFEKESLNNVYEWLGLDSTKIREALLESVIIQTLGIYDRAFLTYNGIRIDIKVDDWLRLQNSPDSLFEFPLDKVRADLSGSGLDYLRSIGKNVDVDFRDPEKLLPNCHVTRCDFAFDFVNYGYDETTGKYLDITGVLIDYIRDNVACNEHGSLNRCVIINKKSYLKCDYKLNGQRTTYFGSTNSEKLLRVYDKKLQYFDDRAGVYIKENPYNNPYSWHRIEWQTRNKFANEICFGSGEGGFLSILRKIYEEYNFADMKTPAWRRLPYSKWYEIFDWESIPSFATFAFNEIIFVPKIEKVLTYHQQTEIQHLIWVLSHYSFDEYKALLNNFLLSMQNYSESLFPEKNRKRLLAFCNNMIECGFDSTYYQTHNSVLTYDNVNNIYTVNDSYFDTTKTTLLKFVTFFPEFQLYNIFDENNKLLTTGYRNQFESYFSAPVLNSFIDKDNKINIFLKGEY